MKQFKTIDFWVSSLLIAIFTIASIFKGNETFMYGYFIVGGWQIISMIIHIAARCFTYKGGVRNIYCWIVLISIVTVPVGSFVVLLFTAPVMAIYYTWICYNEVYVKMQRPLALLK
jgi:hypothetical protein